MSILRFTDPAWDRIERHLDDASAERFAFAFTRVLADGAEGPVLHVDGVDGVELVPDDEVEHGATGPTVGPATLDRVRRRAVVEQRGLVEIRSQRSGPPHLTPAHEAELAAASDRVDMLLGGRPYAAAVRADGALHAEWFRGAGRTGTRGVFRSVTVVGDRLRLLNADWVDEDRFHRQVPLLGHPGQAALRRLRVAVVGAGGTGSHAVTLLGRLGVRDLLLLGDDVIDPTSLSQVVTAGPGDIGAPNTLTARHRVLVLDHHATVRTLPGLTPRDHPELLDVDLVIGCVDDDGPRHRLNDLAVTAGVPYLDIGTGGDAGIDPPAMGARVAFVLPGGPCLTCTAELDASEVDRWYDPRPRPDDTPGPAGGNAVAAVVHLDALAVSAALAEIVAWVSGTRPPALRLDIDVNGGAGQPGTRISPWGDRTRRADCPDCAPA